MLPTFNNSPAYRFTTARGVDYAIAFMPFKHEDRHIPQLQLLQKTGDTWATFKQLEERTPMWGTDADERESIPTPILVQGIVRSFNEALPPEDRAPIQEKWEEVLEFILEQVRFQDGQLRVIGES